MSFLKNWFGSAASPIGVDFGTDSLKMAQIKWADGEPQLIAAATADVPASIRTNSSSRMAFFADTARDLLAQGSFSGRQAILALPAASMMIQHLRLAKMDEEELTKAIPWEARGKLPIDPTHAQLRHYIAGEVYHDSESKNEVILIAAAKEAVNQLLAAAAKAKLDVIGMNVEPTTILDCFGHIYKRKTDATAVNCFVDIGAVSSRAIIAQGGHMLFARAIGIGGDHFNRAVATAFKISQDEARVLRIKLSNVQQPAEQEVEEQRDKNEIKSASRPAAAQGRAASGENDFALLRAGMKASEAAAEGAAVERRRPVVAEEAEEAPRFTRRSEAPVKNINEQDEQQQLKLVEGACKQPLNQLVEELDLCRRYYESTFQNKPMERLIFIGGEAKQRGLCQQIAKGLGLAAQIGDPLVRMGRTTDIGIESGLDRRQPQPGWAVAIGLSLGPVKDTPK